MDLDLGRRSIVEWARGAPEEEAADFVPAEEKFVVEAPIGKGGMGEVFLVTDQDLRRQVAMKVLRRDAAVGRDQRLHFIAEAQATSQLEHPGIPPVHDMGLTPDGRLYFTMKLVQGRTLREVLHDLTLKRREVAREYTLHKLVSVLERVCEAIYFSHEKGVIHRDLKPENLMLGDYGEVHVMDWGLARVEGSSTEEYADVETVETARMDAGLETQHGAVKGTLPYMSPEQVRGGDLDRRSDLYAIGCLLYEVLTLQSAFDPSDPEIVARKQMGDFPDVAERNPRRKVPPALAEICRRAMATEARERFPSARDLGAALRGWLDGRSERERRHREAEALTEKGRKAALEYVRLEAAVKEAEHAADAEARNYEPWQPVSEKLPLLEARRHVEDAQVSVALGFAEAIKHLGAALVAEADHPGARAALADLWKGRLSDAERRHDAVDTAYALEMVGRYHDGPLASDGSLQLASDPPGAEVCLYRYVERDGVLVPEEERSLGRTPIGPVPLPMGSYLSVLKKERFRDTRYPVHITRERRWKGEVKLRADDEIGEGFVLVPKGPFVYGEEKETETKELPDFAIAGNPVTFREYAQFLMELDEKEAADRLPHTAGDGPYLERLEDGTYRPTPINVEGKARDFCLERYGADFEWQLPVSGVSYDDALAYCEWKTKTTGREWRLPTEEEREKAARGVDGRRFPWGDLEDASLGHCRESRPHGSQPEPVGAFPTAESVYGMGDASGGQWDWTQSWFDERRESRVLRGGSWNLPTGDLRCAFRLRSLPRLRLSLVGFRCARGL